MRRLRYFYVIPIVLSLVVAIALVTILFPTALYSKAVLVIGIPLMILGLGFRVITYQRIQTIKNQLYQILQNLEEFDVDEPKKIAFEESPFPILNELNEYLVELIDRIRGNYQANKQFTQNAAHELQTPLAIIKGHIEILLQSPNIGEKEIQSLAIALQNTNRLAKINAALILLSKIEHQRFADTEKVSFTEIIEMVLENFHDLIEMQALNIDKKFEGDFIIEMSSTLAEILVANLIQNAIRHNTEKGTITIDVNPTQFTIKNTGRAIEVSPEVFFKRFKRKSDVDESLGLGLSIVKRICEQSDLMVTYNYAPPLHILQIHQENF